MKYIFLFFIFLTFVMGVCNKYELESDEIFKIKIIKNSNFLTVYSKSFNIDFFLECKNGTNIYAKSLSNNNINNLLKIKTNIKIKNIKISNNSKEGYIEEIKFTANNELLSSLIKKNTFYINKNKNTLYSLRKEKKNKLSMPLGFQCTQEYFFNNYKIKSLFFEDEEIDIDYISNKIRKWKLKRNNNANKQLTQWFINCEKWKEITKNNNLQEMYSIDTQVTLESLKVHKKSEELLRNLQQQAINNENLNQDIIKDFINMMNALKTLEKNKSTYSIFHNINDLFYIRNDKNLKEKLKYILSYNQNSYYYDLLSNTKIGFLNDNGYLKLNFIPLRLDIFAFNTNKDFLVIKITNSINLIEENTQLATYKLSNSFCQFLNTKINNVNKKIFNKIEALEYCSDKKNTTSYTSEIKNIYKKKITSSLIKEKIISNSNIDKCKNIENGIFCKNILKNKISFHIKKGMKLPSLDALIDNFDDEIYEGITIYAPKNKYFFFNEDIGWESVNATESNTIDLILIR